MLLFYVLLVLRGGFPMVHYCRGYYDGSILGGGVRGVDDTEEITAFFRGTYPPVIPQPVITGSG